jgi:hypothetical protein
MTPRHGAMPNTSATLCGTSAAAGVADEAVTCDACITVIDFCATLVKRGWSKAAKHARRNAVTLPPPGLLPDEERQWWTTSATETIEDVERRRAVLVRLAALRNMASGLRFPLPMVTGLDHG